MSYGTTTHERQDLMPARYQVVTESATALRPIERRILRWVARGADDAEIAHRFGRSIRWVAQVRLLAELDRAAADPAAPAAGRTQAPDGRLRPLERRLLRWREQGIDHDELSIRFRRRPEFLARVERYARFKLSTARTDRPKDE